MPLWLILSAFTAFILAILLVPVLRRRGDLATRTDYDLRVYRDQLKELEGDRARNLISPEQAKSARIEIERRILALGAEAGSETARKSRRGARLTAIGLLLVAVPVLSGLLYMRLGSPALPDLPLAERDAPPATEMAADIQAAIDGLAERLADQPDDPDGWQLLARSYAFAGRYDDAVEAYRTAQTLAPDNVQIMTGLGEAMVYAAQGQVTPAARIVFNQVMDRAPADPIAGFYVGLGDVQAGDISAALTRWTALVETAPADAPWLDGLREQIRALAEQHGLPVPEAAVATAAPAPPPGPTAEEMAAAADMTPDERAAMVGAMVARLEERLVDAPDDPEGWKRLGRAKRVLGDVDAAREAYARAAELAPEDVEALTALGETLVALEGAAVPEEAVALFDRALALAPNDPTALWFAGLSAAQSGAPDTARSHWQRLLLQMPEGSEEHDLLSERITGLDSP